MGLFDYLRGLMGWWSAKPMGVRLTQIQSYSGGPQVVQSYPGGAGEQVEAYSGGPVQVMVAEIEG